MRIQRVRLGVLPRGTSRLNPAPIRGRCVLGSGYAASTQPSCRWSRSVFMRLSIRNLMLESFKSNSGCGAGAVNAAGGAADSDGGAGGEVWLWTSQAVAMSPNAMTNANLFVNAIVRAAETSVWPNDTPKPAATRPAEPDRLSPKIRNLRRVTGTHIPWTCSFLRILKFLAEARRPCLYSIILIQRNRALSDSSPTETH